MASIHLPPISIPVPENRLHIQQDTGALPRFTPGQILEARVLGRLDGERLLIRIQNQNLVAQTAIPLQAGERLQLRVEGLKPLLTLILLETSGGESARTGEALRAMRSDPQALAKSLAGLLEALDSENPGGGPVKDDAGRILHRLRSLVFSRNTAGNPLWVRDSLQSLGLFVESDLRKGLQGGSAKGLPERTVSLKELLLRLVETLRREGDGEGGKGLLQKLNLFDGALKNIESLQVLNVLLQEQEGKYFLQVPLLLSGGMTTADIFVQVDRESRKGKKDSEAFRVVFALHMDALGEVVVHARWQGKRLDCRIECGSEEVQTFIGPSLAGLAERLAALGFQIGEMACTARGDLGQKMEEIFRQELSPTAVDLFA